MDIRNKRYLAAGFRTMSETVYLAQVSAVIFPMAKRMGERRQRDFEVPCLSIPEARVRPSYANQFAASQK